MMDVFTKYRPDGGDWRFREALGPEGAVLDADGKPAEHALPVLECRLRLSRDVLPHETPQLRGFFGRKFADEVMLHHHRPDGTLLYQYPMVQFKVINRVAVLLGLGEGSGLVSRLWLAVDQARLGAEDLSVMEANMIWRPTAIGATDEPVKYRFLTPWLALNQDNARRYQAATSARERSALLERVLIGNCLSFAKAFQHNVKTRLAVECSDLQPIRTTLKGTRMIGFKGTVKVNFLLPNLVGIGKSVSRGFGAVLRIGNETTEEVEP